MDIRLRQIVSKSAGTYFIVTDNSQVPVIEGESRLRLIPASFETGPVNIAVKFAKGDKTSLEAVFGKATRAQEKKGNFSYQTCMDAIEGGPIAVLNLRKFDATRDKCGVTQISIAPGEIETKSNISYTSLFNTNGFYIPKENNLTDLVFNSSSVKNVLQFANIGNSGFSILVIKPKVTDIAVLTAEGDNTLKTTKLKIDDYPALKDKNMLVKDSFVTVLLFNNDFTTTPNTNKYYGNLFNGTSILGLDNLEVLKTVTEAGYVRSFTGSLIPGLLSETGEEISIERVINQYYAETGLLCNINEDLFEIETTTIPFIDFNGYSNYDFTTTNLTAASNKLNSKTPSIISTSLTYNLPTELIIGNKYLSVPTDGAILRIKDETNSSRLGAYGDKKFVTVKFIDGIRIGDFIVDENDKIQVVGEIIITNPDDPEIDQLCDVILSDSYVGAKSVKFDNGTSGDASDDVQVIFKVKDLINNYTIKPIFLKSIDYQSAWFADGTASRQKEILDMLNDPGIVKGLRSLQGLRYIVDAWKSYVEPSYKKQYGDLMVTLDGANRFVRSIVNEPFMEDLQKSSNPLFKQMPTMPFDISYLPDGGNKNYSTKLLTKIVSGASMCFFFGPGDVVRGVTKPVAGKVSNLFYNKTYQFDVVANETGYVDGITELEYNIDDVEREFTEKFRYNSIINFNGGNTIYCNLSGQKERTAQQQIQNSELLAYIKQSLYDMAKGEAFKKGNYDDYLRTETECLDFMNNLSLAGAIDPNPVVICNASNNTLEIRKQRIKLVHIEYTPVDALEKVVFDLTIN
jgi:hypothetical protein